MGTGARVVVATSGYPASGNGHLTPAPTGAIPTTITTSKAGRFMKAIGTTKITAITTTIITTAGMTITTTTTASQKSILNSIG
jgi:hypothetical protein